MKLTLRARLTPRDTEEGFGVLALRRAPRARSLSAVFCGRVDKPTVKGLAYPPLVVILALLVGCSSPAAERNEMLHRAGIAPVFEARSSDAVLLDGLKSVLPGVAPPENLLRKVGPDKQFAGLARWHGQIGEWQVDALQTTNDSQIACPPWGSITSVSATARRKDARDALAQWRATLTKMFEAGPREVVAERASWWRPGSAMWYGIVQATDDSLQIGFACASFDFLVGPRSEQERVAFLRGHVTKEWPQP